MGCPYSALTVNSADLPSEGDLTDQASCPRSSGSDPQTVISDTLVHSACGVKVKAASRLSPHSPTFRHNPFNEDSDTNTTNTSADVTPVHVASRHNSTSAAGDDMESVGNELEVIRCSSGNWFVCCLVFSTGRVSCLMSM